MSISGEIQRLQQKACLEEALKARNNLVRSASGLRNPSKYQKSFCKTEGNGKEQSQWPKKYRLRVSFSGKSSQEKRKATSFNSPGKLLKTRKQNNENGKIKVKGNCEKTKKQKQKNPVYFHHPISMTNYCKKMAVTEPNCHELRKKKKKIVFETFNNSNHFNYDPLSRESKCDEFQSEEQARYLQANNFDHAEKIFESTPSKIEKSSLVKKKSLVVPGKNEKRIKIEMFPSIRYFVEPSQISEQKSEISKGALNQTKKADNIKQTFSNHEKSLTSFKSLESNNQEESKLIFKRSVKNTILKTIKTMKSFKSVKNCKTVAEIEGMDSLEGEKGEEIGRGSSGVVWKVKLRELDKVIVVKRVEICGGSKEYLMMESLSGHPFIANILDAQKSSKHSGYWMEIFMDYYPDKDLSKSLQKEGNFSFSKIKVIAYQIFRGLHYIHSKGIVHRDIKSQNIFMKGNKAVIGDFGSAKFANEEQRNSTYLCSRSNRAPQLICGNLNYDEKVDVWSAGCVIVEMVLGYPLFESPNSEDLMIEIIRQLGTPPLEQYEKMTGSKKRIPYSVLPKNVRKKEWKEILEESDLTQSFIDLLDQIFHYDSGQRLSSLGALMHPFFDQIRDQAQFYQLKSHFNVGENFFIFLPNEIGLSDQSKLLPHWIPQQFKFQPSDEQL